MEPWRQQKAGSLYVTEMALIVHIAKNYLVFLLYLKHFTYSNKLLFYLTVFVDSTISMSTPARTDILGSGQRAMLRI